MVEHRSQVVTVVVFRIRPCTEFAMLKRSGQRPAALCCMWPGADACLCGENEGSRDATRPAQPWSRPVRLPFPLGLALFGPSTPKNHAPDGCQVQARHARPRVLGAIRGNPSDFGPEGAATLSLAVATGALSGPALPGFFPLAALDLDAAAAVAAAAAATTSSSSSPATGATAMWVGSLSGYAALVRATRAGSSNFLRMGSRYMFRASATPVFRSPGNSCGGARFVHPIVTRYGPTEPCTHQHVLVMR